MCSEIADMGTLTFFQPHSIVPFSLNSIHSRHTGEEEITTTRHLFQQLSIALVKGNAALLNNRNPCDGAQGDEGLGW